jgi:dihydroxyacid dehydratase/phosphogluconate dehydratase
MEDVHKIGGIPAILKYLLNHSDLIDGNQLTITGKTLAQNLEDVQELSFETQDVVRKIEEPLKRTGHLTILHGNLCPGSAVAKMTGKEGLRFEVRLSFQPFGTFLSSSKGTAKCFDRSFSFHCNHLKLIKGQS